MSVSVINVIYICWGRGDAAVPGLILAGDARYVFLTNHGAAGDGVTLVVHPSGFNHVEFRLLIKLG